MSQYHKTLKQEIRQLKLDTIALRRIRKEMERELEAEYIQDTVDAHIEQIAESRNWRN